MVAIIDLILPAGGHDALPGLTGGLSDGVPGAILALAAVIGAGLLLVALSRRRGSERKTRSEAAQSPPTQNEPPTQVLPDRVAELRSAVPKVATRQPPWARVIEARMAFEQTEEGEKAREEAIRERIKANKEAAARQRKARKRAEQELRERVEQEQAEAEKARRRTIPDKVRMYVWQRDEGRCVECGTNEKLEYDHIIPLAMGGSNTDRNLQLLCEECNRRKGPRLTVEADP